MMTVHEVSALARETLKAGVTPMKFDTFDKTEQVKFAAEVKKKWGGTAAHQEYQKHEQDGIGIPCSSLFLAADTSSFRSLLSFLAL